ncbi:MAG TPA: dNTP triphosphohydrolase [Thermoanaerobaculia bacterium]|nr:dNTP triphosphohydrolase [Thermoanaerobaculia bacterium]
MKKPSATWEDRQEALLSPAAARSSRATRPYGDPAERDDPFRAAYARDRDRILHSRAFRRLKHKTQVFIPFEGDHFRTRLTHTLEVSQIARSVARALALNEDLAEAIALGHDLGHTPFGHSGESVLDALLRGNDPSFPLLREVAAQAGAFKHNYQSVRVVDRLEKRYAHPGLNLTHDVREGILKHTSWKRGFPFPIEFPEGLRLGSGGSLEAQAVNWSDEIAQQAHDLEDGLPMLSEAAIEDLEISRRIRGKRALPSDRSLRRAELVRGLYREMIADLVSASSARIAAFLEKKRIGTADAFDRLRDRLPGNLVGFSDEGARRYRELKQFVYENIIHSFPIARRDGRARLVMRGLFVAFHDNPRLLPDDLLAAYAREEGIRFLRRVSLPEVAGEAEKRYHRRPRFLRAIADHIAGMTDKFALSEYEALTTAFPSQGAL